MNILHVLECFSARYGGPVSMLNSLARAQVSAGHKVTVCTTNLDYPKGILCPPGEEVFCNGSMNIHYFPVQFRPLIFSSQYAKFINKNIENYDIIHIHGLYRFLPTYVARHARKICMPFIIRPHGALDPYLYRRSSFALPIKRLYERWFDLPNLHAAGAIHYTAEEERERASFLQLRAPSFIVPNGIDGARFLDLPKRGVFRAKFGLGENYLVLFLGRLNFKKGLDLLIPAFSQVHQIHPSARLAIVGPDNERYGRKVRDWVQAHNLEDCVKFVDHLDGRRVLEAYVDADVFALPSYTENFGMTALEAMACGTPVVISDQVNIHREIAAANAGLVTPCSTEAIANAINILLADKAKAIEIGSAGRHLALTQYTWPPIVQALTSEYDAVIARTSIRNRNRRYR